MDDSECPLSMSGCSLNDIADYFYGLSEEEVVQAAYSAVSQKSSLDLLLVSPSKKRCIAIECASVY
jgi:hypothetical protein